MAVKMVWKVLRAKNGYDLLREFRYIDSYLVQGRSKVFTTGQARFNPEHYVIKCVGGR